MPMLIHTPALAHTPPHACLYPQGKKIPSHTHLYHPALVCTTGTHSHPHVPAQACSYHPQAHSYFLQLFIPPTPAHAHSYQPLCSFPPPVLILTPHTPPCACSYHPMLIQLVIIHLCLRSRSFIHVFIHACCCPSPPWFSPLVCVCQPFCFVCPLSAHPLVH